MNANETVYGSYADSVASKYGLDTGIFRRLITSESSWNPTAVNPQSVRGEYASGIAQFLPSTAASRNIDPFNPYESLDGAAKYLAELTEKYGLAGGIAKYKGYSDANMTNGLRAASAIIGTDAVTTASNASADAIIKAAAGGKSSSKAIWEYTFDDFKNAIKSGALSTTVGFIGILIIALSIIAVFINRKAIEKVVTVAAKAAV